MKENYLTSVSALLFALSLFTYPAKSESPNHPPLGIWSWKQDSFTSKTARSELFKFCQAEGIVHIDQHISIRKESGIPTVQNSGSLRNLIVEAEENGISVNALRGERAMFFEENHDSTLAQLSAIITFNRSLPDGTSLAGVKFDVEPYLTKEWKSGGPDRLKVMNDYLSFLDKANQHLKQNAPDLDLAVDIPFWWDKPDYVFEYAGDTKKFTHHIQDRTSWIGIMSYRREADDVLRFSESELSYKEVKNQSVAVGLNAIKTGGSEAVTTFFGHPTGEFRTCLADLRKALKQRKSIRLIMLHDYRAFSGYLKNESE